MFDSIQNTWFFAAGIVALATALIHFFAGGREVARPLLLSNDMNDVAKYTNYYCWHLVSITLGAMSLGLIWPAIDPTPPGLAWLWTGIAALFAVWSVALVIWKHLSPIRMPHWVLFAAIAALAGKGLA